MDGKNCNQKHNDHRHGGRQHKSASENQQAADNFYNDGRPAQQIRKRDANRMQNRDESVRTSRELCVTVLDKAETDNKTRRDKSVGKEATHKMLGHGSIKATRIYLRNGTDVEKLRAQMEARDAYVGAFAGEGARNKRPDAAWLAPGGAKRR
jgi:hypothetical protein